jgi:dimethylhistidine N-methyltransferase
MTTGPVDRAEERAPLARDPAPVAAERPTCGAGAGWSATLWAEVIDALRRTPKTLPPKLFYDERGARLFDRICGLDEYYLTRTELAIMRAHAGEMAALAGAGCVLVEYGSGEALKIRLLLDELREPAAYVPIDISAEQLARVARALAADYPGLVVRPLAADYTAPLALPPLPAQAQSARRVAYFPGSTIGNFHPPEAVTFLRGVGRVCGEGGALLLGVDLRKDPAVLHAAYNDAEGVTAAFNHNMLARLNRELGATFDAERFRHYAYYNPVAGRVEMHLVSLEAQIVNVGGERVSFDRGESIWTESSYKYSPCELETLASRAGFEIVRTWTDPDAWFCVLYLEVSPGRTR